jgi:hypothetical protein
MKWKLSVAAILTVLYCFSNSNVDAATLTISVDDISTEVPVRYEEYTDRPGGYFVVDTDDEVFNFLTPDGGISLEGTLDPDPSLLFGSVAFDFGAPSIFGYVFILPLAPVYPNPSVVLDSFSGSVTNGSVGGGVTVTALPPPAGIPVDGDGITEMEVYTLSDDGGVTWKNVGLDLGLSETVPLAPFGSGLTASYNEGPIPTIAGGPWTHMRADINFSLSGGGDIFTFNGAKILIPEPGTLLMALVLFGALSFERATARRI